MRAHGIAFIVIAAGFALVAPACGSETSGGDEGADGGPNGDGNGTLDGGTGTFGDGGNTYNAGDGTPGTCVPLVLPDGTTPACANCQDDDGDGLADWEDPECAGPLDNDEATFGTGIPGDNVDACKQDCFFDGNSGAGDDRCEWNLKCDPKNTAPTSRCPYDEKYKNCPKTQSDDCRKFCAKLTPNGCDCFGCCSVTKPDGTTKDVVLGSSCSLANIDDPAKCNPCTKNTACENDCGRCELCIGKTSVPADCAPTTPPPDGGPGTGGVTCSIEGAQACTADVPCPAGTYCVTGCCIRVITVR